MTEQSGTTETAAPPGASSEDESAQFRSLLASGERVLLVKRRHWFTFVEAGRWFVLSLGIGIGLLLLGQGVPDDGVTGFLNTLLDYGFGIFVLIGIAGALVGGFIASALDIGDLDEFFDIGTWLIAIGGALLLLVIYRMVTRGSATRTGARY